MKSAPLFQQLTFRDWLHWTLVFSVVGLSIAYLNRDYAAERVVFELHHVGLAEHFAGEGERAVTTYPLWGYAGLIAAVGPGVGLTLLQCLTSAGTLALLLLALCSAFPQRRRLLCLILLLALPWHFLHSVHWPASPAASLLVAAALALVYSAQTGQLRWAVGGGLLLGLSCNFRPDKLMLPIALAAVWLSTRYVGPAPSNAGLGEGPGVDWRGPLAFVLVSFALMLPWASHYYAETGRYSMTSSNGGMLAYISLGQLPANPWSVVHSDSHAAEVMQQAQLDAPPWSDAGSQLLMGRFLDNVRSHPAAYARKVLWNLRSLLLAGFYVGDPLLPAEERLQLDVLRERVKLALGVNPNFVEIDGYRAADLWDDPNPSFRAVALLLWQIVGAAAGAVFLWIALAGMLLSRGRMLRDPLLWGCACVVIYQIALCGALQYQPRHMNGVFVFLIPFFVIALERGRLLIERLRSGSE